MSWLVSNTFSPISGDSTMLETTKLAVGGGRVEISEPHCSSPRDGYFHCFAKTPLKFKVTASVSIFNVTHNTGMSEL